MNTKDKQKNHKTTPKIKLPEKPLYPMRINRYLALRSISTRRGADELISKKQVFINGQLAQLGDKVNESDKVEIIEKKNPKINRYYAYHKPVGVTTHSPQVGEEDVLSASKLKGVFPIGRLDKDSSGLIILTNDGRITDPLLNPDSLHEKEYEVSVVNNLRPSFKENMEKGVKIDDYVTKPCKVKILGSKKFNIILTEGKRHQIRRMCEALHNDVQTLKRLRIMNVRLGNLPPNSNRLLEGTELKTLLGDLLPIQK